MNSETKGKKLQTRLFSIISHDKPRSYSYFVYLLSLESPPGSPQAAFEYDEETSEVNEKFI
jgi:hypothetical protein